MTNEYHKIKTVWMRDPDNNHRTLIDGAWATPEFALLQDAEWTWTEKVDGTNIRIGWYGDEVSIAGKTDAAQIHPFLLNRLNAIFTPDRMAAGLKGPCTLYGEGYGARIQKGGGNYISDGVDFILFDVWAECWLERSTVEEIASKLGIKIVPIVETGSLNSAVIYTKQGTKSAWGDFNMEGLVMRPKIELRDRMGRRVTTKVKYKDFKR